MPIRFSTQAANADFLRDDAERAGASEDMPQGVGAGGTRKPAERKADRESRPLPQAKGEATKPGNVKEQDPGER
jgi:hypothetical protein